MCGIFGLVLTPKLVLTPPENIDETVSTPPENIFEIIINGLTQLQNRGYDSAGISVIRPDGSAFDVHKYASTPSESAIQKLINLHLVGHASNQIGIGHNRWATHGIKNDANSHPHLSNNRRFSIVHNGIIENYSELKYMLISKGFAFYSQTDTEVIANLIEYNYTTNQSENTFDAIKRTIAELRGTYGLLIQSLYDPTKLYCVRNGSPLLIGQADDRVIVTSEQSGFCNMVNNYITLHNDDICTIEHDETRIRVTTTHTYIKNAVTLVESELTPHPYEHWTIKEINEQPNVVLNAINNGGRIKNQTEVKLGGLEQHIDTLIRIDNIILLGCGTSYFAGSYGAYLLKQMGVGFNTVQVFDGAEFCDYDIPKNGNTAFVLISQSGETKDLHRCIEIANANRTSVAITIGVINVVDSLIAREVDCGIYCNAGKEVGVASTKAFTSQVIALSMMAIWFAQIHGVSANLRARMITDLHNLSNDVRTTLHDCRATIVEIATNMSATTNMFLLGKGGDECIAKEGALKIKEISYIHAEGYSTSSLKHGPFALLDEACPVVIFNLDQTHLVKTMNCYQEVASRNSPIVFITNSTSSTYSPTMLHINPTIRIPENKTYASLLGIIPIQLLAYYLSINRGINPDKPKNLAKVVTVE